MNQRELKALRDMLSLSDEDVRADVERALKFLRNRGTSVDAIDSAAWPELDAIRRRWLPILQSLVEANDDARH